MLENQLLCLVLWCLHNWLGCILNILALPGCRSLYYTMVVRIMNSKLIRMLKKSSRRSCFLKALFIIVFLQALAPMLVWWLRDMFKSPVHPATYSVLMPTHSLRSARLLEFVKHYCKRDEFPHLHQIYIIWNDPTGAPMPEHIIQAIKSDRVGYR